MTNPYSGGSTGLPFLSGGVDPSVFDKIGNDIQSIINPNYQTQKAFKDFITANPDKLQSYVDLSQLNPQAFASLKLGKVGDAMVQGGTLSPEAAIKKKESEALANNPKAAAQMLSRTSGIKTGEENQIQAGQIAAQGQEADMRKVQIANDQLNNTFLTLRNSLEQGKATEDQANKGLGTAFQAFQNQLPKTVTKNLYLQDKQGLFNPDLKRAIFANPEIKDQYDEDAKTYFEQQRTQLERDRLSGKLDGDNYLRAATYREAESNSVKTGNPDIQSFAKLAQPGQMQTMGAIYSAIKNSPNPQVQEQNLGSNPSIQGQYMAYKSLMDYQKKQGDKDSFKQDQEVRRLGAVVNSQFQKVQNTIISLDKGGGARPADVDIEVQNYNNNVNDANAAGANKPSLIWDANKHTLNFIQNGKAVPANPAMLNDNVGQKSDDQKVQDLSDMLAKSTNYNGDLALIKSQVPQLYDKIVSETNRKKGKP